MDGGARELGLCAPGGIQIWHEETVSLGEKCENERLGGCLDLSGSCFWWRLRLLSKVFSGEVSDPKNGSEASTWRVPS